MAVNASTAFFTLREAASLAAFSFAAAEAAFFTATGSAAGAFAGAALAGTVAATADLDFASLAGLALADAVFPAAGLDAADFTAAVLLVPEATADFAAAVLPAPEDGTALADVVLGAASCAVTTLDGTELLPPLPLAAPPFAVPLIGAALADTDFAADFLPADLAAAAEAFGFEMIWATAVQALKDSRYGSRVRGMAEFRLPNRLRFGKF